MNLINELNEKRYTLKGLSQTYYRNVMSAVRRISQKGKLDIDTYIAHAENDPRLDYVPYDDFLELTQLQKRYEEAVQEVAKGEMSRVRRDDELWENKMEHLTNRALIRHLSQNMCEDDTKAILEQNYLALANLGYDGRQDEGIPEIVRGNFNIFQRNKEKQEDIKILKETIDRTRLYLIETTPHSSRDTQKYAIERILKNGKTISQVRSDLKFHGRAPFETYKEQFLKDYHEEQFRSVRTIFDVHNEQKRIKDDAIGGMMEVDEKTYKRLSQLGYEGKDGHPLIQSGYQMYIRSYVLDKELNYSLNVSEDLCFDLRAKYPYVAEWANINSATRKDVDPMTNLFLELFWDSAISKYKKGKISEERYDEIKDLMHEMDVAMQEEKIYTAIGNVRKVRAVAEKNAPRPR